MFRRSHGDTLIDLFNAPCLVQAKQASSASVKNRFVLFKKIHSVSIFSALKYNLKKHIRFFVGLHSYLLHSI